LKPVNFWREDAIANAASRKTVTNRPGSRSVKPH
jgi:hypothetical protein